VAADLDIENRPVRRRCPPWLWFFPRLLPKTPASAITRAWSPVARAG